MGSWAAPVLSMGAALGLLAAVVQPAPARAITAEQFNQLTYSQVKGSGLANRCPTVENQGTSIQVKPGSRMRYVCFEPKSFAVEAELEPGKEGQEELFKETNKVFDIGKGAIEMEVNKVNQDLGEIGGVFVAKQPSDTDMGAKEPKTILLKGIFYGKVV